jgi:hypothetical protein
LSRAPASDGKATSLLAELYAILHQPLEPRLDETAFDAFALRIFEHQYTHNRPYRAYCDRRRRTPDTVSSWADIPVVPTAAFKAVPLVAGDETVAQAVFRTSGTTAGHEKRGTRYMVELGLYHAAAVSFFRSCVLPDEADLPFLSLMPPARELPDSSLAHMIELVSDRLGADGSECFAGVDAGLETERLLSRLRDAETAGRPVCLLGTSLAFVHLLDTLTRVAVRIRLPAGSRLMDTGGTKGATRSVEADELRDRYAALLGIEPSYCINEYGMTELCSQFYDDALRSHLQDDGAATPRRKIGPRWVRSRVVDPESLEPVAGGETGILQHFDLANYDAVLAVQTEDIAREIEGGFVLLGRDPASPPRGCSIAMDELISATRSS